MISYFIYTLISLGCSYTVYFLILRKQKTFQFNRFFLLGSFVLCLLAPFLEFEVFNNVPSISKIPIQTFNGTSDVSQSIEYLSIEGVEIKIPAQHNPLIYVYLAITSFLVFRFLKNFIKIQQLINGKYERFGKLKIIKTNDSEFVSSFFNYMFINENQALNNDDYLSIVKHETIHCEEKHSLDIIFTELMICIFWFNPFVWFYKKAILQNHEYIADDKSVSSGIDIENYSNTIINLGQKEYRIPLTSGFNFIQIKNRIIMLHQSKSSVLNRTLKMTFVSLLFAGIFVLSCTYKDTNEPLLVVVDAGHGGKDSGNFNEDDREKYIVLQITNLLASLSDEKVEIVLTRTNDEFLSLQERADFINNINPDLFLSLHCNAHNDSSIKGTEAYFNPKHKNAQTSLKYARILVEHQSDNFYNRGIKEAGFFLLKNTLVPGVYLELGFMTNESDSTVLSDKNQKEKIAKSIYEGLLKIRNQIK
ncbi:M56/M15 family metallopeptidase [Winogradskyella forsetii]|uniref:M56/M15 family metallopeptidase n=1 Tax=Winogradskyella forsetii TaxID=2686077 RepID=UPI0015BD8265|nr:M56/M15 family metallopeptidase [Winogradskyella forsetii]